jgi:sugar/nucleoside kinase (ribokinase family)
VTGNHTAVVAGHICLDIIPQITGIRPEEFQASFGPGRLLQVGRVSLSTGGPVSNTGLVLHKLGIATQLMGKTGDDLFGQAVRQIIAGYDSRLVDGMILDPAADTSYTVVINPPGIDRIFLHCPGANDTFTADDVRYDLVAQARLFHFGYPPLMRLMYADDGAQLVEIFRRARQTGVTTSLDMAVSDPASAAGRANWRQILTATLPYVDLFQPSIEEILYMLRRNTFDELSRHSQGGDILPAVTPQLLTDLSGELLSLGAKIVALKLGYRGLYLRTAGSTALADMGRAGPADPVAWADQELWVACFRADVVGTTGSGDSTIAGFLSALLRGMGPDEAATAAVAVGGCNVEAADALSGIRPWDDTMRRVADGWQHHPLVLDVPGWRYDAERQLWHKE